MHLSSTIATFITSAAVVDGLYFHIEPLAAVDIYNPTPSHRVDFTVNNPDAVYEQGGSDAATCSLTWYITHITPTGSPKSHIIIPNANKESHKRNTTNIPTCWTQCTGGSGTYYTRISPNLTYTCADDFSLDIWQSYVYELGNHNNASVTISPSSSTGGEDGFACMQDDRCKICQTTAEGKGFDQSLEQFYGGAVPGGDVC
ncbi:hypothetical protein KC318_g4663 [Hortaea werneckii]|uniref:Uncharacterized protein n=1 Tax=Hortaea werneckii TaxID=91943 RepID=A0A3M7A4Z7_HORWE|nr:hypothetical protein KC334_g4822 [Hortaea werneckii]KAI7015567.1 hypothetical protein KC355_g4293 [Hortaea werneckii]KAI7669439.1 hypothetical protein KC318_g4663 [Hortaea werneckii]RMY09588.1 hypothetical protein D0867_08672 [Hortaea werneckii]RMY22533.1 hypothetical protein D0866_11915 [Hortaea werneckii]